MVEALPEDDDWGDGEDLDDWGDWEDPEVNMEFDEPGLNKNVSSFNNAMEIYSSKGRKDINFVTQE